MDSDQNESVFNALILKYFVSQRNRKRFCRANTLFLTFIAYVAYNLARRPIAVVKNSLNGNCSNLIPPSGFNITDSNKDSWCNWHPFQEGIANRLLGGMDYAYISTYAIAMFFSGMIAERTNLRYFLSFGMLSCGMFTYLFGIAYCANIHSYAYFVIVLILDGAVQSTGWPGVVACTGSWFGRNRRGIIFGAWSSHMFIGTILGSYITGYFAQIDWGMSFIVPSVIVGGVGFLLFLFLIPYPIDVGCYVHDYSRTQLCIPQFVPANEEYSADRSPLGSFFFHHSDNSDSVVSENSSLGRRPSLNSCSSEPHMNEEDEELTLRAIPFSRALKIPGILEYSMCLFFTKLVIYTFLFWLPRYLSHRMKKNAQEAAYISVAFDVGGILGGITAGALLDKSETSGLTSIAYLALSIPFLLLYHIYGARSNYSNITLQVICGALVNGPYVLITTAVTAELGTHYTIEEGFKALATVAAIVDGIGSIGAAVGPLLAGFTSDISWDNVFYMMMGANFCAVLCLARIGCEEAKALYHRTYHWSAISPTSSDYCLHPCRTERETYESIR